jgi:trk system potassium uptake protein TrkH
MLAGGAALLITADLVLAAGWDPGEAIRAAAFQAASISSSTGFVSADFDVWPTFSKLVLLGLMFMGGCAGSTAGGLKTTRVMLLFASLRAVLRHKLHPQLVAEVRVGGQQYSHAVLRGVLRFFFMYLMLDILWSLLLVFDGVPMFDAIGVSVSAMGSVGPGFGTCGATCTLSALPDFSKAVLALAMLMGRLEIFTVLALFMPELWRGSKW